MGASGWDYVIDYDGDVEAAVTALQARVFQEEYGDHATYRSMDDLYADHEFMGTEGTHTILDIDRLVVTDAPAVSSDDYGTLRPLALDRVLHHFGTRSPSVEQFEKVVEAASEAYENSLLDECRIQWAACYVLLHTGGTPTHLGIFGSSGD
ncbi:hypothetical protein [Streptomyces sp. NPDC060194]|uniref:hypothetical protein n=1 Tax=Streptomyces sp. NPDC060194 TaxID=3347069 RepID=UPI00364AFB77